MLYNNVIHSAYTSAVHLDASTVLALLELVALLLSPLEKNELFNALGLNIGFTTPTTPARSPKPVRPGVSFPSFLGVSRPLVAPPLGSRFGVSRFKFAGDEALDLGGGVGGGADENGVGGGGPEGGGIAGGKRGAALPARFCIELMLRPATGPGLVLRPSLVPARLVRVVA